MYEHLRGKILEVVGHAYMVRAKVVDIDFDIGITIINDEDHNDYLQCIFGPTGFKAMWEGEEHPDVKNYEKEFHRIAKDAEQGLFIMPSTEELIERYGNEFSGNPSSETCAFNR